MVPNENIEISVVVPVYESAETLSLLVSTVGEVLRGMTTRYEIILVNDGSKDSSWEVIANLERVNAEVRGICLMRNYGQHNAILCGIRNAKYPITVTLDDDLQNPPEEIPKLVNKLLEGYDVVYGVPEKQQHGILRNFSSIITKLILQQAMGSETARNIYAFRAFRTVLCRAFENYNNPTVFIDVLLSWGGSRFTAVKVRQNQRLHGQSNYNLMKLIITALNMITGFSTIPLRIASLNGFLCIGFGVIAMLYVVSVCIIYHGPVPGFTFLACLIIVFAGAQLLALGIIGEYLANMYRRSMDRPVYVTLPSGNLRERFSEPIENGAP